LDVFSNGKNTLIEATFLSTFESTSGASSAIEHPFNHLSIQKRVFLSLPTWVYIKLATSFLVTEQGDPIHSKAYSDQS
jgi:hypothetical protein